MRVAKSWPILQGQKRKLLVSNKPATGKGAVQLDYTFPIKDKLKGYVRYFDGYGMNLLDYNHYNRSIGFGIKLTDWHSL